ncbi:helix-turn-helix domain-containing protein [Rhizobium puerariae]|uniref:Helix-turn-helix domain-containing protein n=1 Tax=Rhizobium puerariae TaxID=1585791 RepID=A0ABV6ANU5_9HYPH
MPLEKRFEPLAARPGHLIAAAAMARPPQLPASLPLRTACRIVRQMVAEMVLLFGDRVMLRRDRRRIACHVRQIAMYVCHVALRISMSDIGDAFGRDRTTVSHACHVVEDRRDDPAFDEFVGAVERIVTAVFGLSEVAAHE